MPRKAVRLAAFAVTVFGVYNLCSLWHWQFYARDLGYPLLTKKISTDFSPGELQALEKALIKVAFENKTVILTTLNRAWSSGGILDIFLESFRVGQGTGFLLDHLLIVALDKISYDLCMSVHGHCYALHTAGVNFASAKNFMTQDFLRLMWRRIYLMGAILELGYSFVFTDADVMWFRNPLPHFHPSADFEVAADNYPVNHADAALPNCGFVHARANNRTVRLYKFWHNSRLLFPGHDQDVLTAVMFKDEFWHLRVKMRLLRTELFGSFCQARNRVGKVCTMHANCCIGLQRKARDLRLLASDWARYINATRGNSSVYGKDDEDFRWSVPKECLESTYQGQSVYRDGNRPDQLYVPSPRKKRWKWWKITS